MWTKTFCLIQMIFCCIPHVAVAFVAKQHDVRLVSTRLRHHPIEDNKKRFMKNLSTSILAAFFSLTSSGSLVFASDGKVLNEVWSIVNENFVDSTYNNNDWSKVKQDYIKRVESGGDEQELTKKMLSLLGDKYTRLLDKQYFESLWKYDAIGVGLLLQSGDKPGDKLIVSAPPLSGSSGEKSGLQKGDIVYAINGKSTDGMTAMMALDMLSNDDSDSLTIEYGKENTNDKKKTVVLKRTKTEPADPPVSYSAKTLSSGKQIGYIKLRDFNSEAIPAMKNAIMDLDAQQIDAMILDLRGNTGGGFQFALNIGGMFMDNKPMVTAVAKNDERSTFPSSYQGGVLTKKPLILWMDELSASASEVLAGGLHDNCRAVIVGSNSFGKGKIQAVFGLNDGEGLTMTVAQYVTPRGTVIQSKGLKPDIPIPTVNAYVNLISGPVFNEPNFNKLDLDRIQQAFSTCEAVTATIKKSVPSE